MADRVRVRPARPHERKALMGLQWRASLDSGTYGTDLLAHPDAVDLDPDWIDEGRVLVAEAGAGLLGFCVVVPIEEGEAELDGLFVEPSAMRRGVGLRLLEHFPPKWKPVRRRKCSNFNVS